MSEPKSTRDQYPQFLRGFAGEASANVGAVQPIKTNVPIAQGNSVLVLNLLRILWNANLGDFEDGSQIIIALSTVNYTSFNGYSQKGMLFMRTMKTVGAGGDTEDMSGNHALHVGDGKGPLVGNDEIYLYVKGVGQNDPVSVHAAVEYTLVKMRGVELVGVVSGN